MWFSNLIDIENWKRRMVTITESNDSNQQQQQSKNDEQQQQNFEQHVVPDKFYGRYRLTTSDNFDAFLREIGKYFSKKNFIYEEKKTFFFFVFVFQALVFLPEN